MCDNDSIHDILEFQRRAELSRRQFGAMTVGTGLMFMLPKLANAAEVKESELEIKTPDGTCDAYFVHPSDGKHPGVLIWPDIFGLRPRSGKWPCDWRSPVTRCSSSIRSIARRKRRSLQKARASRIRLCAPRSCSSPAR